MARILVTLLAAWWTLLPPGACACHVHAMLAPPHAEDHDHHPAPCDSEGHDESESCSCAERPADGLPPTNPEAEGDPSFAAWLPPSAPAPTVRAPSLDSPAIGRPSASPLYLILRALRI